MIAAPLGIIGWMCVMDSAAVFCMTRSLHIEGEKITFRLMLSELPSENMHSSVVTSILFIV